MLMEEQSSENFLVTFGFLTLLSILVGCTNPPAPQIQVPQKPAIENPVKPNPGNETTTPNQTTSQGAASNQGATSDQGSVKTRLNASDLQAVKIDLKDLKYKFSYLDIVREGDLSFVSGVATLSFDNLPVGKEGTLALDIIQKGTLALSGNAVKVTLKSGSQTIDLVLRSPTQQSSSVTIQATIDASTATPPPVSPVVVVVPPVVPPPTVETLNWDGKSFQGNARWDITPVN